MRAIRFARHGDPRDALVLENLASPEPDAGEVRLRFTHRPINPADLLIVRGDYRIRETPPLSPGLEGVGIAHGERPGRRGKILLVG